MFHTLKEDSQVAGNTVFCHSTMAEICWWIHFFSLSGPDSGAGGDSVQLRSLSKVYLIIFSKQLGGNTKDLNFLLHWKVPTALLRLLSSHLKSNKYRLQQHGCNSIYSTKEKKADRQLKGRKGWKKTPCSFNDWHFQRSPGIYLHRVQKLWLQHL